MNLNAVQEIERAIDALTPDQREELYVWLDEHYLQSGDMQLKAAIDAGHFDDRITRALADHKPEERNPSSAGPPDAPRQRRILERVSGFARRYLRTGGYEQANCLEPTPATLRIKPN